MPTARDIVTPLVDIAIKEAAEFKIPADVIARVMFEQAIRIWREVRSPEDIRDELISAADQLDPNEDFTFMRP